MTGTAIHPLTTATATATTATTATATTTTIGGTTTNTWSSVFFRFGFVHFHGSTHPIGSIKLFNGFVFFRFSFHFHKSKASDFSCFTVFRKLNSFNLTVLFKDLF